MGQIVVRMRMADNDAAWANHKSIAMAAKIHLLQPISQQLEIPHRQIERQHADNLSVPADGRRVRNHRYFAASGVYVRLAPPRASFLYRLLVPFLLAIERHVTGRE